MSETLELLEKLNTFYAGAFGQLVTYTVGILALVGVLIPIGIAAFQNRQLKRDQSALSAHISAEMLVAQSKLKDALDKEMQAREEKLRELVASTKAEIAREIKKIDDLAMGRSLHLQASSMATEMPGLAVRDCLNAVVSYAEGGDERNLQAVLHIFRDAVKRADSSDIKNFEIEKAAKSAAAALKKLNAGGRYSADIQTIEFEIAELKERRRPSGASEAAK